MAPASGWYPDPAGTAQLRFWDGHSWINSTAAQATPRNRKKLYGIVAGVVAIAAVVATTIPLTSSGSKPPTTARLSAVLLTANEVDQTVTGNFTSSPATANSSSNTSVDCKDTVKASKGAEKAKAGREFTDAGQFAEEDLSYTDGATALLQGLKAQVSKCHTITTGGTSLHLTILSAPTVQGSDDTFGIAATGMSSGTHITVVLDFARFGNGVIMLTYGGQAPAAAVADTAHQLIRKAAAKANGAY